MSVEAKWAGGVTEIPQARPAQNVEWVWSDGMNGYVEVAEYVAAAGGITGPLVGSRLAGCGGPLVGRRLAA